MEFYKSAGYNCSDKTAFVQWINQVFVPVVGILVMLI